MPVRCPQLLVFAPVPIGSLGCLVAAVRDAGAEAPGARVRPLIGEY